MEPGLTNTRPSRRCSVPLRWAVPIGPEIGRRAGDHLRQFAESHAVELGDALIAATASIHQRSLLWTHNRKHYPMKDCRFLSIASTDSHEPKPTDRNWKLENRKSARQCAIRALEFPISIFKFRVSLPAIRYPLTQGQNS